MQSGDDDAGLGVGHPWRHDGVVADPRDPSTAHDAGPGGGLLHPVVVVSLAVLLLNDHVLKGLARGTPWSLVTGKLSDIAGLVFLPVLVVAAFEVLAVVRGHHRGPSPRQALIVAVIVAVVFVAMNTNHHAGAAYAWSLAALQWPARALVAWLSSTPTPTLRPVAHVVDPTDVIGVVGVWWVVWQTRCRASARDVRRG
jgi:hypothetical protein